MRSSRTRLCTLTKKEDTKMKYMVREETGWSSAPASKIYDTYEEAAAEKARLEEARKDMAPHTKRIFRLEVVSVFG